MSVRPVRLASRSKYGVNQSPEGKLARTVDGILFASQAEARRYGELKLLEKAGEIRGLILQPRFALHAALTLADISRERDPVALGEYRGDFLFEERLCAKGGPIAARREWRCIVEDIKGFATPLYKWKKKHVEAQHGITIREIKR